MTQTRQYTQTNPSGGNQWKPHMTEKNGMVMSKNALDNQLEGYYLSSKEISGQDNKNFTVYSVQTVNPDGSLGDIFDVAGGKVLDELMANCQMGSFIMIKYAGRRHKKGYTGHFTQTNSYHVWEHFTDANAIPFSQLKSGNKTNSQPVNTMQTNNTAKVNTQNNSKTFQSTNNQKANPFSNVNVDDDSDLPF